jgi:hypothetical protein
LHDARLEGDTIATIAAWSSTFGINETDYLDERYDTLHMLSLLDREAKLARSQVKDSPDVSNDEIDSTFQAVSQAMDISALSQVWQHRKEFITDGVLRTLRSFSRDLPEDSEKVNEYQLSQLQDELEEFARHVEEDIEDGDLKAFLLNQITIIRKAFLEYYVVGARSFRDASGSFFTEAQKPENKKVVQENEGSEEINKLRSLWGTCLKLYATYNALQDIGAKQSIESSVEVVKDYLL